MRIPLYLSIHGGRAVRKFRVWGCYGTRCPAAPCEHGRWDTAAPVLVSAGAARQLPSGLFRLPLTSAAPHLCQHVTLPVLFTLATLEVCLCIVFYSLLQDRLGRGNRRKVSWQGVVSKNGGHRLPWDPLKNAGQSPC